MVAQPIRMTEDEYLAFERTTETKHELIDGQVYAMSGGTMRHHRIAGDTYGTLHIQLLGGPCEPFPSDMQVHIPATGSFVYPDVSVVCGEPELRQGPGDLLLNPTLVVEVLSPSTESYDRNLKFRHYWTIPTLQQYVLIYQDEPLVECFTRQADASWRLDIAEGLNSTVELASIGCTLTLADVYARVDFDDFQ